MEHGSVQGQSRVKYRWLGICGFPAGCRVRSIRLFFQAHCGEDLIAVVVYREEASEGF
jgi:hypothetical protein